MKLKIFLLSVAKNCKTLIAQAYRIPEEILEFKLNQPRETSNINPPKLVEGSWMVGLIGEKLYNSLFKITEKNIKIELYTDTFDQFSFLDLKHELQEIHSISVITPYHLQHAIKGPRFIQTYTKLGLEKSSTYGYILLFLGYARPPFRGFESYFRVVVDLDEDVIQIILKQ